MSSAGRLESMKRASEDLAEPFRSANLWIPEGTITYNDCMSYWEPFAWYNHDGKLTLCGDAAHPLPPRRYLTTAWLPRAKE